MPKAVVRLSAGRQDMPESIQALCFMAGANSIFYGEKLLTTGNPDVARDQALFAKLFDADRLMQALQDYGITNLSAAATHYRMMKNAGTAGRYRFAMQKLSYTGEPMDSETLEFVSQTFRRPVCSMYGTTEIGVILVNYPGATDFEVKPGSLGKPVPNVAVEVQRPDGGPTAPGEVGEIKLRRKGAWQPTRDLGRVDEDGYFFHAGRADDVIISAGWTMSAVEIEDALLAHPDIREAAAIGVPDEVRGQVVKAFLVTSRDNDAGFQKEIQDFVRNRLSQHEYPRQIATLPELPKTPAGKVNRKILRDRERAERFRQEHLREGVGWSRGIPSHRRQRALRWQGFAPATA
jgi:acetyl-CoA synthetase